MLQIEGTAGTRLKGMSVPGGVRELSTPVRLEYAKQGNKPMGRSEDLPGVSGGQEQSDLAGRKG